jgi:hypothetical protein
MAPGSLEMVAQILFGREFEEIPPTTRIAGCGEYVQMYSIWRWRVIAPEPDTEIGESMLCKHQSSHQPVASQVCPPVSPFGLLGAADAPTRIFVLCSSTHRSCSPLRVSSAATEQRLMQLRRVGSAVKCGRLLAPLRLSSPSVASVAGKIPIVMDAKMFGMIRE